MKRRHLLLALGASAMGWSRRAYAAERLIGLLVGLPQTNGSVVDRLNVFRDTLSRLGWVEHRNIRFEYCFEPDATRLSQRATELIERGCELIVAWSTPETVAAIGRYKDDPDCVFHCRGPRW
jgi:hypothetical protein